MTGWAVPFGVCPRGATLGRYVVLDCLGSGGMGVVYRAHDFALDRRVSLKLLRSGGKDPEARRERLIVEAQALARVSHPNVLAVHDVGTWDDEVYLALEHVEGETPRRAGSTGFPRTPSEVRGGVPPGRSGACRPSTRRAWSTATSSRRTSWSVATAGCGWRTWAWR